MITQLSRVRQLRVRALASSERLERSVLQDPDAAGRQLGAAYVIDGSAQRVDGHVRVNVRLLSVGNGRTIWADTLDTRVEDVFTLQDRISGEVVTALALPPIALERRHKPRDEGSHQAYRAWRQGHHLAEAGCGEPGKGAGCVPVGDRSGCHVLPCLRRMALAYRGLVHLDHEPDEMFPLARAAVAQALKFDPDSPEALLAQGRIQNLYDWNWVAAEASLRRARVGSEPDGKPSRLRAPAGTSRPVRRGAGRGPPGPRTRSIVADGQCAVGRILHCRRTAGGCTKAGAAALELKPGFWIALQIRGGMALDRGDTEAAADDLAIAVEGSRRASQILAVQGIVHAQAGDRTLAQTILRELEARRAERYVPATSFAAVHAALGDAGAALEKLERAHGEHDIRMAFLKVDARWNVLRPQPWFQALARRMGLESDRGYGHL